MRYSSIILFLIFLTISVTSVSHALPRFALMTGAKCGSCHVNPTGGQIRNEYGSLFSVDALPLRATKDEDFTFDPKISESITLGGDYRGQLIADFGKDYLQAGDSVSGKTSFHAMTAALYGSVQLSKKIIFYFKHDILNTAYGQRSGPEIYSIAKVLPNNWYIKGGAFLPDFGWRVDDHTAYTRGGDIGFVPGGLFSNGLIFTPNYRDLGVEVGGYMGDLMVTASLLNGSGNFTKIYFSKDKAYTAKVEYMGSLSTFNYRLGASGYGYRSYKMGSVHLGFAIGDLVIFGEMDWTHHREKSFAFGQDISIDEQTNQMAAFAEIDYRIIQGLWLIGKFDMFDPQSGLADDDATPGTNSIKRLMLGFELFPYSHVEVRPQYRIIMEKPSIANDQALIQMHLWF